MFKITAITLTKVNDNSELNDYEATITINNEFVVQVEGNDEEATFFGVPHSDDAYHSDKEKQDLAWENIDKNEIENAMEELGFENNIGWLEDNADTII